MARRKYEPGRCQDCGNFGRCTVARFWLNGLTMRLCARCVRYYRKVLNT